jgi:SAM-dependent methyltransferase
MIPDGYHETRLPHDPKREIVWGALWRFRFSAMVSPEDCVLDLGSGYGSFINAVVARRRIAIDAWAGFPAYLAPGVEAKVGSVSDLDFLDDGSVDFAFASNLFEHLTRDDLQAVLDGLRRKLSPRGTLTLLQPNYRYAYREYFDDFDHKSIWSHVSMADYLASQGWDVLQVEPRFMPLTVKGRLPVNERLVQMWLASPWKPIGKQMLIRAKPRA